MKITDILSPDMVLPELQGNANRKSCTSWRVTLLANTARSIPQRCPQCSPSASGWVQPRSAMGSPSPTASSPASIASSASSAHQRGVDFDSLDGGPTYLFFLLVAPEDSASLHLKALARVSRLMKDPAFRERLSSAPDAAEIFA